MSVIRLSQGIAVACLVFGVYTLSYAVNSLAGGYWDKPERDGRDRWFGGLGLSMQTAVLWQPRFGYWALYRSDTLGALYSPLIRFDRRFIHPTRYITDRDFTAWSQAAKTSDWHPSCR